MTPRELRAAVILARSYELVDIFAARTREYIAAGDPEMASRMASRAAFNAGYAQWVEAKVNPSLRPFLAAASSRKPDEWVDTARVRQEYVL